MVEFKNLLHKVMYISATILDIADNVMATCTVSVYAITVKQTELVDFQVHGKLLCLIVVIDLHVLLKIVAQITNKRYCSLLIWED